MIIKYDGGWRGEGGGERGEGLTIYKEKGKLTIYTSRRKDNSPSHPSWKKTEEEFLTLNLAAVLFVRLGEA